MESKSDIEEEYLEWFDEGQEYLEVDESPEQSGAALFRLLVLVISVRCQFQVSCAFLWCPSVFLVWSVVFGFGLVSTSAVVRLPS